MRRIGHHGGYVHGRRIGRVRWVLLLRIRIHSRGAFGTGIVWREAGRSGHWGDVPVGLLVGRRLRRRAGHLLHGVVGSRVRLAGRGVLLFSSSRRIAVRAWLYCAALDGMAITATRIRAPWIVGQRDGGARDRDSPRAALNRDNRGTQRAGPVERRQTRRAGERRAAGQGVEGQGGALACAGLEAGSRARTGRRVIWRC
jgi:hypothetical protein